MNRVSRMSKGVAAFEADRDVDVCPRVATACSEPKFSRVRLSSVPGFYWPPDGARCSRGSWGR